HEFALHPTKNISSGSKHSLAYRKARLNCPALVSAAEAYFGSWDKPCMLLASIQQEAIDQVRKSVQPSNFWCDRCESQDDHTDRQKSAFRDVVIRSDPSQG